MVSLKSLLGLAIRGLEHAKSVQFYFLVKRLIHRGSSTKALSRIVYKF